MGGGRRARTTPAVGDRKDPNVDAVRSETEQNADRRGTRRQNVRQRGTEKDVPVVSVAYSRAGGRRTGVELNVGVGVGVLGQRYIPV